MVVFLNIQAHLYFLYFLLVLSGTYLFNYLCELSAPKRMSGLLSFLFKLLLHKALLSLTIERIEYRKYRTIE